MGLLNPTHLDSATAQSHRCPLNVQYDNRMSHHKKPVKPLPPNDKLYLQLANANDEKAYNVLLKAMTKQPFVAQVSMQYIYLNV